MALLPVADAQARLLALGDPVAIEYAPLDDCANRWLAADLVADRDQPWADLSSMDGYAVRAQDAPGPWRIAGESRAGAAMPPALSPREAVRIFTGAPVPPGADAILIQEDAKVDDGRIRMVDGQLAPGLFIRPRASDFAKGAHLLSSGEPLTSARIGLAALAGYGRLRVRRRLRVALLSTGDELVPAGVPVPPGMLPSSNALMLRALLTDLPCDITDLGIVPDRLQAMTEAFNGARDADIILSTGGASVGDHDLVKPGFESAGGTLDFWKIRMRPGKPLIAGTLDRAIFLGLPGNPVAAFVTGLLFLLPLVRHLSGSAAPFPAITSRRLGAALPGTSDRDDYIRARHICDAVVPVGPHDSAAMYALAAADCLILRPAGSAPLGPGARVDIMPFS